MTDHACLRTVKSDGRTHVDVADLLSLIRHTERHARVGLYQAKMARRPLDATVLAGGAALLAGLATQIELQCLTDVSDIVRDAT